MDGRLTTIELFKENQKFSAGHFTIFSATNRENLHGHNFTIYVALTGVVGPNGLMADYGRFKKQISEMCETWNETFMLPGCSPYLRIEQTDGGVIAHYADEKIPFLARDITVLPVSNVTIEELARLFGERLTADPDALARLAVVGVEVKCASGPGQWACWRWSAATSPTEERP